MYEAFFLAVLIPLVIFLMRPGKTVLYDSPLVVHRPGQYHLTLAPALSGAQNFLEHIAHEVGASLAGDVATQFYEVRAGERYLLAVGFRGGLLYFQAILPPSRGGDYQALREFSEQVLVHHPLSAAPDESGAVRLCAAVDVAACQAGFECAQLKS